MIWSGRINLIDIDIDIAGYGKYTKITTRVESAFKVTQVRSTHMDIQ